MMKRFAKVVLMMAAVAILGLPAFGAVSETFDGFTNGSYGNYDINGFHTNNCIVDAVGATTGCVNPLPSNCVRIRNAAGAYLEYIGLDGNGKDGGVGVIEFDYKAWDPSPTAICDVTVSVDGGAYFAIDPLNNNVCTAYAHYSYTLNNSSNNIKIKIAWVSGERMHIDNFSITDYGSAVTENDAHVIVGGPGASATISSLVDTQPEAQIVFTFDVYDAGDGDAGINTIINAINITQGSANTISNWTYVLAGAELTDGVSTWTGTINTGSIGFIGSPLLTLADGSAPLTLTLTAWLRTDLPYYADNEILEFNVAPSSFSTDPAGAGFDPADAPVESGDTNNEIDIVGTQLGITTQPPASACLNQNFTVRAGFTDVNGGIDEDYPPEAITLAVNTGTGTLSSVTGLTLVSTSGQSAWTDLRYNVAETGVILEATSISFPTPVLTNAFDVITCPTIVVDAMPLCWDGNATVDAVPFVVHISINDWTAQAGNDVYVKVYDGGANPYHYVAGSWSSSTAWSAKPIATLDANGNWAGWLALKSKGLTKFKPRAALTTSTGTYITGDEVVGTMVDLTTTGVVVEDRDGIRSNGTPGNIVLVRNGGGGILGSWIIEDNGYLLDDGGSPIAAGGWRLAMCDVCEDVTFESWDPANWPGHGVASFFDVVTNFCPTPGTVVEMNDVVLPVELVSFTAVAGDRMITLNWKTASETNNDHFVIARDGADLATVDARGNVAGNTYSWTEENLDNGTNYVYTLIAVDVNGNRSELGTVNATPAENAALITEYALYQNYPNPFNPTTQIRFDLVESGFVSLKVYNLMGQSVATLVNGTMTAGQHTVAFDAANLPSGLYLYRVEVNGFAAEKKMLLMK
ncbi:MAG: T9SS type A sorting domain-containing protein [Calditrichota bacterium]